MSIDQLQHTNIKPAVLIFVDSSSAPRTDTSFHRGPAELQARTREGEGSHQSRLAESTLANHHDRKVSAPLRN